jgi:hypothetical protein
VLDPPPPQAVSATALKSAVKAVHERR